MDKAISTQVIIGAFLATKNPEYYLVLFADTEVEVEDELHITQFNTRLISKTNKERYQKLMDKGTKVLMNTTPRD